MWRGSLREEKIRVWLDEIYHTVPRAHLLGSIHKNKEEGNMAVGYAKGQNGPRKGKGVWG